MEGGVEIKQQKCKSLVSILIEDRGPAWGHLWVIKQPHSQRKKNPDWGVCPGCVSQLEATAVAMRTSRGTSRLGATETHRQSLHRSFSDPGQGDRPRARIYSSSRPPAAPSSRHGLAGQRTPRLAAASGRPAVNAALCVSFPERSSATQRRERGCRPETRAGPE